MTTLEPGKQGAEPSGTMRLLCVSDVVEPQLYNNSVKDWIGPVDLLISCGDLPPYYLDFLASTLGAPLVHVLGNHCYLPHDPVTRQCSPDAYMGAFNLDGRVAQCNGLLVAGLEGSPLYNMGPHQYTEQRVAWKLFRLTLALVFEKVQRGRYLDVMVTHAPPRGIHDNPDVAHKGFESLVTFIDRVKPTVLVHGHTHRYDPMQETHTRVGETEVINVYGHALLTLVWEGKASRWKLETLKTQWSAKDKIMY
jgi:Icc-related predicted phosphoesterase